MEPRKTAAIALADWGSVVRPPPEAALLWPVRHRLFDFASELSEMDGETLVKLALPQIRRASRDLFCIVRFGATISPRWPSCPAWTFFPGRQLRWTLSIRNDKRDDAESEQAGSDQEPKRECNLGHRD
jgi:hypothetical protein